MARAVGYYSPTQVTNTKYQWEVADAALVKRIGTLDSSIDQVRGMVDNIQNHVNHHYHLLREMRELVGAMEKEIYELKAAKGNGCRVVVKKGRNTVNVRVR